MNLHLKQIVNYIYKTKLSHNTIERNGGRIKKRTAYATNDIDWLEEKGEWKNLSCIGAILRQFEKNGEKVVNDITTSQV